jgi:hypothetical protein
MCPRTVLRALWDGFGISSWSTLEAASLGVAFAFGEGSTGAAVEGVAGAVVGAAVAAAAADPFESVVGGVLEATDGVSLAG